MCVCLRQDFQRVVLAIECDQCNQRDFEIAERPWSPEGKGSANPKCSIGIGGFWGSKCSSRRCLHHSFSRDWENVWKIEEWGCIWHEEKGSLQIRVPLHRQKEQQLCLPHPEADRGNGNFGDPSQHRALINRPFQKSMNPMPHRHTCQQILRWLQKKYSWGQKDRPAVCFSHEGW